MVRPARPAGRYPWAVGRPAGGRDPVPAGPVIRPWSVYVIRWPWYVVRVAYTAGRGPWFAGRGHSERLLTKGTYA